MYLSMCVYLGFNCRTQSFVSSIPYKIQTVPRMLYILYVYYLHTYIWRMWSFVLLQKQNCCTHMKLVFVSMALLSFFCCLNFKGSNTCFRSCYCFYSLTLFQTQLCVDENWNSIFFICHPGPCMACRMPYIVLTLFTHSLWGDDKLNVLVGLGVVSAKNALRYKKFAGNNFKN